MTKNKNTNQKCWLRVADAINLITSADKEGNVIFESRGLSPVFITISNIDGVKNMVAEAALTNDEVLALINRAKGDKLC